MAGLRLPAFGGKSFVAGTHAGNRLAVVLNSPAHHFAIGQRDKIADAMRLDLAALDADGDGLFLDIQEVLPAPPVQVRW